MEKHRCEAVVHDPRCNGWADNIDHFTPKCLIKFLKLDKSLLTDKENLAYMNHYCHALKDATTPKVLQEAKLQQQGKFIGLGQHI